MLIRHLRGPTNVYTRTQFFEQMGDNVAFDRHAKENADVCILPLYGAHTHTHLL